MSKPPKDARAAPRTPNSTDARAALRLPPRAPAAPPVYRPQPVPKVLQRKEAVPARVPAPRAPTPRACEPPRRQPDVQRTRANVPPARVAVAQPRAVPVRPAAARPVPAAVPPKPVGAPVIQRMRETRSHHPRPSRDDRNRERLTKQTLKTVDKHGRTRGSSEAIKTLKKKLKKKELTFEDLKPAIDNSPPHKLTLSGYKIYSGKWRNFSSDFQKNWWKGQSKPWACHICKKKIEPHGEGPEAPSIDHKVPWAQTKLGIADFEVCKGSQHWRVVLSEHVRAVIEDESNLLPAHKGCNSGKNGPKNTDSLAPQRLKKCPGKGCTVSKAE